MAIYKIEQKRPEDSRFLNYGNFLACILLASDWFKDTRLLSQLTHAHYRDTVPLKTTVSSFRIRGRYRCDLFSLLRFEYQVRLFSTFSAIFTAECGLRPIRFRQFFGGEAMLPANRRILDKLDGVKFLFIVRVIEEAERKAKFSFYGLKKAFHYEIVLREIQAYFLHGGERLACFELF